MRDGASAVDVPMRDGASAVDVPPGAVVGELYLTAEELATRVDELGAELGRDYAGLNPLLVCSLKASIVFAADLSRTLGIPHELDFLQLESYRGGRPGIRLLKDVDAEIAGRHVVVVEDVVDTGLTLNYLVRHLSLRAPASIAAATLLDRPYRRLIGDLPVRYVGFTVPDELFVGYGFDLDERYRNLPSLHLYRSPED